jgi:hypothetical protein
LYRQSVDEVTVTMQRIEEFGVSMTQIMVGIMLTLMGFMVYYFIPLAFMFQDFTTFNFLMNLIFIMIVFGLVFLAQIV